MSGDDTTRWTVTVSKDTDIAVRSLLAQRGLKKGDLSRFIEDAVKWRVFDQTTTEVREAFVDLTPESLQDLIDEATDSVRKDIRNTLVRAAKKES
ncbi:MAG: ribbon-helix-helix domain-containing protein [Candidatus Competibacteraceae bacterium]